MAEAYTFETAHPKAKELMKDEFFWSPIEGTGPFGNDDGWEAAHGFRKWRFNNKSSSPMLYLNELIAAWALPSFDWHEMDTNKIKTFITSKTLTGEAAIEKEVKNLKELLNNMPDTSMRLSDEKLRQTVIATSRGMGGVYILSQDNAIIGTAFAQLAFEGKIDRELKTLAITAINRQLLPVLIERYDTGYKETREDQLKKMLKVVRHD